MKKLLLLPLLIVTCLCFAQDTKEIIGKPVKIGNLLVAQNDFPKAMNRWDAYDACDALGDGWRLPTEIELNKLYLNRLKIGGFRKKPAADWVQGDYVKDFWSTYWTSFTEGRQFAKLQYFSNGRQNLGNAFDKINVRAVKSL